MAETDELPDDVKLFIVQSLACFETPSLVATAVKEEFDIIVTRQRVHAYDPTKKAGEGLGAALRAVFEAARQSYLEETIKVTIANKVHRLRKLDRIARRAELVGNHMMVMQACEAAAKEMGGAYTNEQKLKHSGTVTVASKEQRDAAVAAASRADA